MHITTKLNTSSAVCRRAAFLALLIGILGFVGCGKSESNGGAADTNQAVTSISITGDDRMRFSQTEFTVKSGTEITVDFRNIGRMPRETMGHNFVLLQKGVAADAFAAASIQHPDTGYISPDLREQVIASTPVLGPGESETLSFTAPAEPGDYPFICSFPGHTPAGMKGVMKVIP